jgi:hypothetical protein
MSGQNWDDPTPRQLAYAAQIQKRLHMSRELMDAYCTREFRAPFARLKKQGMVRLLDRISEWNAIPGDVLELTGQSRLDLTPAESETT